MHLNIHYRVFRYSQIIGNSILPFEILNLTLDFTCSPNRTTHIFGKIFCKGKALYCISAYYIILVKGNRKSVLRIVGLYVYPCVFRFWHILSVISHNVFVCYEGFKISSTLRKLRGFTNKGRNKVNIKMELKLGVDWINLA